MRIFSSLSSALLIGIAVPPALVADEYSLVSRRSGNPGYQYFPSPEDWRDTGMYQIFTDRFYDGNHANNLSRHNTWGGAWYNESNRNDEDARHLFQGGDWAGLKQKLDYLRDMGIKAIWISGVQRNEQGADKKFTPYHAYHPSDLYHCEPMFGTFQELRELVDAAHSKGMYVILDVVPNHMADLLMFSDCSCDHTYYCGGGCGTLTWRDNNVRFGAPFDNPSFFHNNGKINNWDSYPENVLGHFMGTEDLRTEDAYVQGELDAAFKNLIEATDCDGFRVDAIKHMEYNWIKQWADNMRKHAAWLGKSNFLLFGEYFSYSDDAQASYCKDNGYSFNSTLWFPMQLTLKNVFAYEQGTSQLAGRMNAMGVYGEAADKLVAFMDNHDVDRIALECGDAWLAKLKPALTFMFTALPVPCLFYGTEHGFNQAGRRNGSPEQGQADFQRETMFNYGWQWGNAYGDKFVQSELYNHVKALNQAREQYISLRRGAITQRWQEGGKGLFAYSRTYGNEDALVVFNTDWGTKSCNPSVGKPDGTVYVNALNPAESVTVIGGKLAVSVSAKESKIFVTGAAAGGKVTTTCANGKLRIVFKNTAGPLKDSSPIFVGIGHDGFQDHAGYEMTNTDNGWVYRYDTAAVVSNVDFYFRDGLNPPTYDNNNGQDWHVPVADCGAIALEWAGHVVQWPADGNVSPSDDLWVNIESWPQGAATGGDVVFSSNGGTTWTNVRLGFNGVIANNDAWHANLGRFGVGVTIQYAIVATNPAASIWDNNNGSDYKTKIKSGTNAITWIGATYHWPTNGAITSADDLWINIESAPLQAGGTGAVVYSSDGGSNWSAAALSHAGTAGSHDWWHVNIGKFPGDTVVKYAVKVTDTTGEDHWDNNNGNDYAALVGMPLSSVIWYGNTGRRGAPNPSLTLAYDPAGSAMMLHAGNAKQGAAYALLNSSNLVDWTFMSRLSATSASLNVSVGDAGSPALPNPSFYRLRIEEFPDAPVYGDEQIVVTIETHPQGGATAATLVYSVDGGAHWDGMPMWHSGTSGNNDVWTAAIGQHAPGTVVQYAVEIMDQQGNAQWDNNGGADYTFTVQAP